MSTQGFDGGDDYTPMSEMNMIPFIDVMLVLLIISMVTTPFLEQGVNVELPVAEGGQSLEKKAASEPVILFITKNQNLRLGEKPIARQELTTELQALFGKDSSRELFVRADKSVPYGIVAQIMTEVQGAGVERVALVTQPE